MDILKLKDLRKMNALDGNKELYFKVQVDKELKLWEERWVIAQKTLRDKEARYQNLKKSPICLKPKENDKNATNKI